MLIEFQQAIEDSIGTLLFVSPDHAYFTVLSLVALVALAIFGHLLAVYVAGSKSGWVSHMFAALLPIFFGVVAMAVSKLYVEPHLADENVAYWATIPIGIVAYIIVALIVASKILEADGIIGLGTMVLSVGAMISVVVITKAGLDSFEGSEKIIKETNDRFELE